MKLAVLSTTLHSRPRSRNAQYNLEIDQLFIRSMLRLLVQFVNVESKASGTEAHNQYEQVLCVHVLTQ